MTSTQVALVTGVVGNGIVFAFWLLMVLLPHARNGKVLFMIALLCAITSAAIGIPSALLSYRHYDTPDTTIGLMLCLLPLPLAVLLVNVFEWFTKH